MDVYGSEIHQVFVKFLDGKHKALNFGTQSIPVTALKQRIESLTSIPAHLQLLLSGNSRILQDDQTLTPIQSRENFAFTETLDSNGRSQCVRDGNLVGNSPEKSMGLEAKFPTVVHLLLRLRGGKGGFGSLLRGAATKAGQKKTNNFDACRDMSGRRLRHVNAEKKLEEWRAEAEERKLEKMAEEFIKKKAKEAEKSGKSKGGNSAEKYVAKYREDSAKCMEKVERSVKESVKGFVSSKRKSSPEGSNDDSKRLKIWLGKRKAGDSDSDSEDMDEDEAGEDEKSVVIDSGNHSDSSRDAEGTSDSITGRKLDTESIPEGPSESGSEEEGTLGNESSKSSENMDFYSEGSKGKSSCDPVVESPENVMPNGIDLEVPNKSDSFKVEKSASLQPGISSSVKEVASAVEARSCVTYEPVHEEPASYGVNIQDSDKPLNFDDYHSATELEVLGLERLKSELQARGLKCGGTLQERAARLFLLKTTPLEKLPKKLFAKK